MKNSKVSKTGAVVITMLFLGTMLLAPSFSATFEKTNSKMNNYFEKTIIIPDAFIDETGQDFVRRYEFSDIPKEDVMFAGEQNDIGYNCDAGKSIVRSIPLYVGEPVDQTVPGRGRTGSLDPDSNDKDDWYLFSVCEGQNIQASLNSGENYDFELLGNDGVSVGQSYTADVTGLYFLHIFANDGAGTGDYILSVTLGSQNDVGTGNDAGDEIGSATPIVPGSYSGYMDVSDTEDWYSFNANSGEGIFVTVEPIEKSDYDIHLYKPSGELVHSAQYYGDDDLEYPADASGTWKIKLDMFPGWDESKWHDNYFLYGSGAYELALEVGGTAEAPIVAIPQPDITPVAQTFIVDDDPNSNKDEYGEIKWRKLKHI